MQGCQRARLRMMRHPPSPLTVVALYAALISGIVKSSGVPPQTAPGDEYVEALLPGDEYVEALLEAAGRRGSPLDLTRVCYRYCTEFGLTCDDSAPLIPCLQQCIDSPGGIGTERDAFGDTAWCRLNRVRAAKIGWRGEDGPANGATTRAPVPTGPPSVHAWNCRQVLSCDAFMPCVRQRPDDHVL